MTSTLARWVRDRSVATRIALAFLFWTLGMFAFIASLYAVTLWDHVDWARIVRWVGVLVAVLVCAVGAALWLGMRALNRMDRENQ